MSRENRTPSPTAKQNFTNRQTKGNELQRKSLDNVYTVEFARRIPQSAETELHFDEGTPDNWILRHPELIRLTGRHPLNAEPPSDLLMKNLITPTSFHYVRNHGTVPQLHWNQHKLLINGLVSQSLLLSMDEIIHQFPAITLPVTLTCDGTRRKELNMIKRGKGFDWGTGGTSCAIWKGVPLHLLLEKAGVKSDNSNARYVCFEGTEMLAKGTYGTSIPLDWAMDPRRDIMVAYEMNGERLRPDHGFPIRMIMPGMVGGRMVKWLAKITVSESESDSWYHWHDNKVLPPNVDRTTANIGGWWWKTGYTLYELNVNSVITSPLHNEWIEAGSSESTYTLRGYAYSGGIPRHHSRWWTWCHWAHIVQVWQLIHSKQIIVRAVDESLNSQPSERTWNLTGMMNNSLYRVKLSWRL